MTADLHGTSLIQRAVTVSRDTLCRRLVMWAAALSFVTGTTSLLLPVESDLLRALSGTPTTLLAGLISLTATVYFSIRFALTAKNAYAPAAVAFWVLALGFGLQSAAGTKYLVAPDGAVISVSWLAAAVLLAAAGKSHSVLQPLGRLSRTLYCSVGAVICVGTPFAAWLAFGDAIVAFLMFLQTPVVAGVGLSALVDIAAAGAIITAIVSHYQRFRTQSDRISVTLCYFLVPCALSLLCRSAAAWGSADMWMMSQMFALTAWPALAVGFGAETAIEHTEISDRLQELETLQDVSWAVVGTQNLSELLQAFAESLQEKLSAKVVTVYLAGDAPDSLKVAAACGPEGPLESIGKQYAVVSTARWPGFHSGHTAKAFTSGETQIASDVFVDVELVSWRTIGKENGCAISVPMVDSEGTLGVLALYFADFRQLTKPRMKLLATLASAATPAIRNTLNGACIRLVQDSDSLDMAA